VIAIFEWPRRSLATFSLADFVTASDLGQAPAQPIRLP
jgi:hypothetical protein